MEDERGGGASVIEAAQKLGLTAVTIEAVDRSGRTPDGQPVANIPRGPRRGLAGLQQRCRRRQRSDRSSTAAMSGTTCSASRRRASAISTRSRTRSRRAGARTRSRAGCAPRRPRWCRSSTRAASSPTKRQRSDSKVETAAGFKRDASLPGVPAGVDHGGVPHRQGRRRADPRRRRQRMDRVPRHRCQRAAGRSRLRRVKKLKDTLQRGLTDEQVAQYVAKLETEIGTTINEAAFAQVTGANNEHIRRMRRFLKAARWTTSNRSSEKSPPAPRCRATRRPPPSTA